MLLLITLLTAWSIAMGSIPQNYMKISEELFEVFIRDYRRNYTDGKEKFARLQIFKQNFEESIKRNMERGENDAVFGLTKFMDMTTEEFQSRYTGLKYAASVPKNKTLCKLLKDKDIKVVKTPVAHDWRAHNAVTAVKYQGVCAGCWAFSAIGNIEGQYAIKHKKLLQFSEQQLLDCDRVSAGCYGGFMAAGFKELIKEGGSELEEDYPFAILNGKCKFNASLIKTKVVDCKSYNLTSQEKLKQLLYQYGPVSIGVKSAILANYVKGIISAKQCDTGRLDHAVLVVGYGVENGMPYWILKNSWAIDWGEKGYYRMERREGLNTCGMLNDFMATSVVA